jgi:hypothetical protein
MHFRLDRKAAFLTSVALVATAAIAQPAPPPAVTQPAAVSTAAPAAQTPPATEPESGFDSRETQREFARLLERHPQGVGVVLKLDPTLFHNEAWLASYPELRTFLQQHPEVAQNPGYFLENVWGPNDSVPESTGARLANRMIENVTIFSVILMIIGALTWLIRTLLEHRRWSRVSRVQTELHNKLLDRFTSHEDLLRYVQSAAGKEFLLTAASPLAGTPPTVAPPVTRILWSVQAGVILVALGIGLLFISGRVPVEAASSFFGMGVMALCAGIGFAVSAGVGYVVAVKLGVWPGTTADETEPRPTRTLTGE